MHHQAPTPRVSELFCVNGLTSWMHSDYKSPRNDKAHRVRVGQVLVLIGAGERNRTLDLLITSELLYQLSYTGICLVRL